MTDEEKAILEELEGQSTQRPPSDDAAAEAALLDLPINSDVKLDTVLPPATYLCRFDTVTVKRSAVKDERDPVTQAMIKKGGNLMLDCRLVIVAGEHAGKMIFDRLMLEGGGTPRLARVASALGFYDHERKCLDFPKPPTAGEIKARLLGQVINVQTKIEKSTFNNEERERAVVTFMGYSAVEAVPDDMPTDEPPAPKPSTAPAPASAPAPPATFA